MDTSGLRAEIERFAKATGGRRFGADLRARLKSAAVSLKRAGTSQTKIAESLGISQVTVGRYLREPDAFSGSAAARPVAVTTTSMTKVTTPSGFEVEGLDVDDIVALIRRLS